MSYHLFLDDERDPQDVKWIDLPMHNWVVVKSFNAFVATIKKRGLPETVSFDHDLSDEHYKEYHNAHNHMMLSFGTIRYHTFKENTGYDAAKWMAKLCVDKKLPIPTYFVHTLNDIGRQNIVSILESAKRILTKS